MASANTNAFTQTGLSYAFSVGTTQTNAVQPVGFASGGGNVRIYNAGPGPVLFLAYQALLGTPSLVFPVSAMPPVGYPGIVIAPGEVSVNGIPANADSFAVISSVTGPSTIYVTRGDGL